MNEEEEDTDTIKINRIERNNYRISFLSVYEYEHFLFFLFQSDKLLFLLYHTQISSQAVLTILGNSIRVQEIR